MEREEIAQALKEMKASNGWAYFEKMIKDKMTAGWEEFIALPVAQKTSKAAFNYQAKYEVLRDLLSALDKEIEISQ